MLLHGCLAGTCLWHVALRSSYEQLVVVFRRRKRKGSLSQACPAVASLERFTAMDDKVQDLPSAVGQAPCFSRGVVCVPARPMLGILLVVAGLVELPPKESIFGFDKLFLIVAVIIASTAWQICRSKPST